jgi:hypothetical protein
MSSHQPVLRQTIANFLAAAQREAKCCNAAFQDGRTFSKSAKTLFTAPHRDKPGRSGQYCAREP